MTSRGSSVLWAILVAFSVAAVLWALVGTPEAAARYGELSRAKRLWERLAPYRLSPTYGAISKKTGVDPIGHLHQKAERLEESLLQSGDLINLVFWAPNIQAQQFQVLSQMKGLIKEQEFDLLTQIQMQAQKRGLGSNYSNLSNLEMIMFGGDMVRVVCRPEQVALAQSTFCSITNRVGWGKLWQFCGSREDVICRLPDGSEVDLGACQKWLNDSIAAGWMVGVAWRSDPKGQGIIVAFRKKAEVDLQPDGPANGSQPIRSEINRTQSAAGSRR